MQNAELTTLAYGSPFTFILSYPWGTPERTQVVEAYKEAQRILCITGICLCVPLIACTLVTRNPVLGKEQSLEDAEGQGSMGRRKGEKGAVV